MLKRYGRIHAIDYHNRMFGIINNKRIEYFYLTRKQMKKFSPYLQAGLYIQFTAADKKIVRSGIATYEVLNFVKMIRRSHYRIITYYDINTIKIGVRNVINTPRNRMFLDMEFTMPPYGNSIMVHIPEIIQYGIVLQDQDGQAITEESALIHPLFSNGINSRTLEFLHREESDFESAISYEEFYNRLKNLIDKYHPAIYIWGKNDYIVLDKSYELHFLKPLTERKDFVNLMQVIKNYKGVKTDIGLFHALEMLTNTKLDEQSHHALTDAEVTRDIFNVFKRLVEKEFKK